jgi:ribonuclease HI
VQGKTSLGWCVRDHDGRFVVAGTSWKYGNYSIIEGEAMTLLDAMKEVEHIGLRNVIFETDSKSVVDAIHRRVNGISEFSSLIVTIKNVLSLFSNFQVKFIKRQANFVAISLIYHLLVLILY